MNKSGIALQAAQKKWTPSEVLVVSDDLELPLSELRIREGGGTGGHNGIASLIEYAESISLKRIRLGIGRDQSVAAHEYVLQPFSDMELELLKPQIEFVVKLLNIYIRFSFSKVLDEFSKWKKNKPNPIDALSG
jgi:PTH1 family peptidyl-tRNA hydrolase